MNYEQRFGTDWTELEPERALIRAFALGVADSYGSEPVGELDRVREEAESRYDLHLIETAYWEGQGFGDEYRGTDGDIDRRLPEFLQDIGIDVDDIIKRDNSESPSKSAPAFITSTPMQHNSPIDSPDMGLPKLLYRLNERH